MAAAAPCLREYYPAQLRGHALVYELQLTSRSTLPSRSGQSLRSNCHATPPQPGQPSATSGFMPLVGASIPRPIAVLALPTVRARRSSCSLAVNRLGVTRYRFGTVLG